MYFLSYILVTPGLFIANTMYIIGTMYLFNDEKNISVYVQYRCNFSKDFLILIGSPRIVESVTITTDIYQFYL